jgi:hypothetical protein
MKVKDQQGKTHEVTEGHNQAGKSTDKRQASTRMRTPKANKSTGSRPKRPARS